MRSLILKELRQGRPLLLFSVAVALLLAAGYAVANRYFADQIALIDWQYPGGPSPISLGFAIAILVAPLLVAVLAGIGLFAGENEHSTNPVLLALPLSRRRLWLGKLLAGALLTAVGAVIIVGLSRLLLPQVYRILPVSAYLPDLCLSLAYLLALSAYMSSVSSYTIAALVAT